MRVHDYLKRLVSVVMIFSVFMVHVSFAAPAIPGNATPVDAGYNDVDSDYEIMPASMLSSVTNTVDRSHVYLEFYYYDMSNAFHRQRVYPDASTGLIRVTRPANFASFARDYYNLGIDKGALPPPGKYTLIADFASNVGFGYKSAYLMAYRDTSNASQNNAYFDSVGFRYVSGDWQTKLTIDTSNVSFLEFRVNSSVMNSAFFDYSGYININFTRFSGDVDFVPFAQSSSDLQQDISDSLSSVSSAVGNISSGISDISSGISNMASAIENLPSAEDIGAAVAGAMEPHYADILTQLHHITEQLHAFWDQLAAYFNDHLIPQMIEDTDRIVEAIENIDLQVTVSMNELTSTLNKNHQEQLANDNKLHQEQLTNDNKNADEIMNSYDNSGMDASNDKLSGALDEYESAEADLVGSVDGYIKDFEYENPFDRFTAPLSDVSYFLTGIYNGLGAMNIPVAFSLTLTIALICIGWYRFRGG